MSISTRVSADNEGAPKRVLIKDHDTLRYILTAAAHLLPDTEMSEDKYDTGGRYILMTFHSGHEAYRFMTFMNDIGTTSTSLEVDIDFNVALYDPWSLLDKVTLRIRHKSETNYVPINYASDYVKTLGGDTLREYVELREYATKKVFPPRTLNDIPQSELIEIERAWQAMNQKG